MNTPEPANWNNFAAEVVAIALRTPDVRDLSINGELKGDFWSRESVQELVNDVATAFSAALSLAVLKAVDEALKGRVALPLTDEQIDAICAPERAMRWKADGRQYDRDTVRLVLSHVFCGFRAAEWPVLLPLLNEYAAAMTDAALHQSASKVDIAKTQAMKALARLRAAIYGDEKRYGDGRPA